MEDDVFEHFNVTIERIPGMRYGFHGKFRVEVTSQELNDPNNNSKEASPSIRNLACFEFLEQGVRSIKVAPTVDQSFNIECVKSNGTAEKTVSVQVIHQRAGHLRDSNEHIATILLAPDKNRVPCKPKILSKFQPRQRESSGVENAAASVTSLTGINITDDDLRRFSRFTLRFVPIIEKMKNDGQDYPNEEERDPEVNGNATGDKDEFNEDCDLEEDDVESFENTTIKMQTVIENIISINIELKNMFFQGNKQFMRGSDLGQSSINDFYYPYNLASNKPHEQDLQEIVRAQAIFQQQNSLQSQNRISNWQVFKSSNKVYLLRKFIKANVKYRLQSLGVQHLDCNEIIEAWEAKQNSPFFQFPEEEEYDKQQRTDQPPGIISPFISKPNSALFQLGPSGHITKSIFSTFVTQVETLKGIMNNATCNLIHISVCLLLPEMKLLWGRQLQTNRNPVFIKEWARLLLMSATELSPGAPEEVVVMVNRELKTLKSLSKQLHRTTKKIFEKIENLSKFTEEVFRKTLGHLNPKSLKKLDAFDIALKKKYSPSYIHFDPAQLHKINIRPADLFRDHLFLSETKTGDLLIKSEMDGFWEKFQNLDFENRRSVFLALTGDLQNNLHTCLSTIQHLQEIYTAGYPGSIKHLLKDVVEELKFTAKREDLTLLIKTSIVTHVTCLHEMLTRLLYISMEVKGITKQFKRSLQPLYFDAKKLNRHYRKRGDQCQTQFSDTDTVRYNSIKGYNHDYEAGIGNSNPQLAIPFSSPGLLFKTQTT